MKRWYFYNENNEVYLIYGVEPPKSLGENFVISELEFEQIYGKRIIYKVLDNELYAEYVDLEYSENVEISKIQMMIESQNEKIDNLQKENSEMMYSLMMGGLL